MANEIEIDIVARLDTIDGQLKSLTKKSEDAGKKISENLSDKINKGFGSLATAAAAGLAAATAAMTVALSKGVGQAIEQENAVNKLNQALKSAGTFSNEASISMQKYATQLQMTTAISDDAALSALALARNFTQTNEQAQKLTDAAVGLAFATGVSLESAVEQLGKTFSGSAGLLSRTVPGLQALTEESLRAGGALDVVAAKFPSAAAGVNTFGQALTQMGNLFNEVLEEIGNLIIKSPKVQELIKFISAEFINLAGSVANFREKSGGMFENFIQKSLEMASAVNSYLIAPFEVFFNIVEFGLNAVRTGIQTTIVVLTEVASGWLQLAGLFTDRFKAAEESVKAFADSSKAVLTDMTKSTGESFNTMFNTGFTESTQAFLDRAVLVAESAQAIAQDSSDKQNQIGQEQLVRASDNFNIYAAAYRAMTEKIKISTRDMANQMVALKVTMTEVFVKGMHAAFVNMGKSIVEGGNIFAAFGKTVLTMFGGLAIKLGEFYFALGFATFWVDRFKGIKMMVAGAALGVIGGALQALGGGGGGVGATGGAGAPGGGGEGGGVTTGIAAPIGSNETIATQAEREVPGQKIEVNIAGNVLGDRRTLGREMADAINEAFGFDGAIIRSGTVV